MPLPLMGALAIGSLAAGAGQGIANAVATGKQKKQNKRRMDELIEQRNAGRFGLDATEQMTLENEMLNPARRAATQQRRRSEQLMGTGGANPADLARLRTEQAEGLGRVGQQAALEVARADRAKADSQERELQQRQQANDMYRTAQINNAFGTVVQGLDTLGAAAGEGPNAFGNFNPFGKPNKKAVEEAAEVAKQNPEQVARAKAEIVAQQKQAEEEARARSVADLAFPDAVWAGPGDNEVTVDEQLSAEYGVPILRTLTGELLFRDPEDGQLHPFAGV